MDTAVAEAGGAGLFIETENAPRIVPPCRQFLSGRSLEELSQPLSVLRGVRALAAGGVRARKGQRLRTPQVAHRARRYRAPVIGRSTGLIDKANIWLGLRWMRNWCLVGDLAWIFKMLAAIFWPSRVMLALSAIELIGSIRNLETRSRPPFVDQSLLDVAGGSCLGVSGFLQIIGGAHE